MSRLIFVFDFLIGWADATEPETRRTTTLKAYKAVHVEQVPIPRAPWLTSSPEILNPLDSLISNTW